jgi:hypothetical protein
MQVRPDDSIVVRSASSGDSFFTPNELETAVTMAKERAHYEGRATVVIHTSRRQGPKSTRSFPWVYAKFSGQMQRKVA